MTDKKLFIIFHFGGLIMIMLGGFGLAHESNQVIQSAVLLFLGTISSWMPLWALFKKFGTQSGFSGGEASFKLGNVKNSKTKTISIGLESDAKYTESELVCELSKRATVQATNEFSDVEPQYVTVELLHITCK